MPHKQGLVNRLDLGTEVDGPRQDRCFEKDEESPKKKNPLKIALEAVTVLVISVVLRHCRQLGYCLVDLYEKALRLLFGGSMG